MTRRVYSSAAGKFVEVASLDVGGTMTKARAREGTLFVKVPLFVAREICSILRTPKAMMGLILLHTAWKTRSQTFLVPNGMLARYGVSREVKRRALAELEDAGKIEVNRQRGRAPVITLLGGWGDLS
jgi:hypothetical protein